MFKATMSLVPSEDKSSRRRQKRRRQKRSQFNKLRHTLGLLEVEQEDSHQQQGQKSLEQIIENEEAEGRLPDVVSMKRRKEIMGEDYDVMMIFHKMGMGLGRGSIPFDGAEETLTPKEKALLEKVMADEETDQRTIHDLSWEEIMAFSPTQRRIAEQAKNDWECRTERHEKHRQEQKEEQEKEEEKEYVYNEGRR
jgi:hypothetical protein